VVGQEQHHRVLPRRLQHGGKPARPFVDGADAGAIPLPRAGDMGRRDVEPPPVRASDRRRPRGLGRSQGIGPGSAGSRTATSRCRSDRRATKGSCGWAKLTVRHRRRPSSGPPARSGWPAAAGAPPPVQVA
jgi:hypothetical protein